MLLLGTILGLVCSALWAALLVLSGTIPVEQVLSQDNRLLLFTGYPATLGLMTGYALTGAFIFRGQTRPLVSPWPDRALMAAVLALLLFSQARLALLAFLGAVCLNIAGPQ